MVLFVEYVYIHVCTHMHILKQEKFRLKQSSSTTVLCCITSSNDLIIYIYIYIYTHTHTYIHTHTQTMMGMIKNRNYMDLTEAEEIKR